MTWYRPGVHAVTPLPYHVAILPEARIALVTTSGRVTGRDLTDACTLIADDVLWVTGFDEVWDLSGADEVDVLPDEFEDLVECTRDYADRVGPNRVVFVTERDVVAILLRLFERLTKDLHRTYHTVRSRGEAAAWLGLAPDALAPDTLPAA